MKEIIVKACGDAATCSSCHAANYSSPSTDHKIVDKLYEVHVGKLCFLLCKDCVSELIAQLQLATGSILEKQITDPAQLYQIVATEEIPVNCPGDQFPIIEFVEMIEDGCITDDDGVGVLIYDNKIVSNSVVAPSFKEVYINPGEDYCSTFNLMDLVVPLGDSVRVMWYNK